MINNEHNKQILYVSLACMFGICISPSDTWKIGHLDRLHNNNDRINSGNNKFNNKM